jgi:16S rRNA (uracil1498-N3)-methyltransferase
MRISRLYTPQTLEIRSVIILDEQRSHYLSRVLRLAVGSQLILFNGNGKEFSATIQEVSKKQVSISLGECSNPQTESSLTTLLGLGLSRGERMDYAVQKSTELGVSCIAPLFTEFSEVKLDTVRAERRREHWQQIAISACEQSGRVRVPLIMAPQNLNNWLETIGVGFKLLCDHRDSVPLPATAPTDDIHLLVGPEGGFSDREVALARAAGFQALSVGKRILRTETAPVAVLAALQARWET